MTLSRARTIWMAGALACAWVGVASAQQHMDRTVLPIQEPDPPTYSELDARNVEAPPRFEVRAPEGAPNVVIVLLDDVGFAQVGSRSAYERAPAFVSANALNYS